MPREAVRMNSIVDSITRLVPSQVISSLALRLGESSFAVQDGIDMSVATLIGGIAHHVGEPGFMMQLFNVVRRSNMSCVLSHLPYLATGASPSFTSEQGTRLASMAFGDRQKSIEYLVENHAGLGAFAGDELMALAAPLTAGFLGQQIEDRNLDVASFSSMIYLEAARIQRALPPGLGSLLSGSSVSSIDGKPISKENDYGRVRASIPLIGLLALALLGWSIFRGYNPRQQLVTSSVVQAATPAPWSPGEFVERRLPNGTTLHIPRLGIENRLIDFIEDRTKPVDRATWFDFDRLTFDAGLATLKASSLEQLRNIAAVLKAYPKVRARIGGYTDNSGDEEANLKLSENRADDVMRELRGRGIDEARLDAKGYGDAHPVADNATEAGREKNRRVSLLVTAK